MRIAIATGIFPPDIGGPALYTEKLARAFTAQGNQVTVVAYGSSLNRSFPYRTIFVSRRLPTPVRQALFFLRMLLVIGHTDWILFQDGFSVGVPGALACKLRRKSFTVRIPGDFSWESARNSSSVSDTIDEFQKRFSFPFRIWIIRLLQRWVCMQSSSIIVPSFYLERIVISWGILRDKIHVVYNAAFDSVSCSRPPHDSIRIISIGRFVPWKGFEILLRAFARVVETDSRFELYFAGDGPLRATFQNEAIRLGIGDKVVFLGTLSHQEIQRELCCADLFALDTEYEGMSHVILEAMSAKAPVATTDIEANKELIVHGVNGVLVRPHDEAGWVKIFLLLKDQSITFKQYAERAYKTIQARHTWEHHFKALSKCVANI